MLKRNTLLYLITFLLPVTYAGILTPPPPQLQVKSYILLNADNGQVIAEKNADMKLPPASLTKIMSMYVIAESLANKHLQLNDTVTVSPNAAKTEGSRMFLKPHEHVAIKDLIKGMMVVSGNDATIALAEYLAGTEQYFATMMNHYASQLNLTNSFFVTATGLSQNKHTATARDLGTIAYRLIQSHPKLMYLYQDKYFSHNKVKQTNRNRLLFKDKNITGLKTGHTSEAGYCLVASQTIDQQNLVAVVMGAQSELSRDSATQTLLNYGNRFYSNLNLFKPGETISKLRVYGGSDKFAELQAHQLISLTIKKGEKANIEYTITQRDISLPINPDNAIADLHVLKDGKKISTYPLFSVQTIARGGAVRRSWDTVVKYWNKVYGS